MAYLRALLFTDPLIILATIVYGGVSFIASYRRESTQVIQSESFGSVLQKLRQAEALTVPGR